ncbi:P-loop containing nucleoside triphosphate hydrolase protein [Roridomyces roridus]|uniref:P-loop containing nucleoside triphosphate hydrolase protein n=1 Tax=Roridomyces roridus TaxID=1738132 RepID=A0AAD7FCD6_9AGAR|nr:P-loop containing nucleoside triphosphate hydrolase protein [Roridomyces roridus]
MHDSTGDPSPPPPPPPHDAKNGRRKFLLFGPRQTTEEPDPQPEDKPKVPPVSFFKLFRFATRGELVLNFLGLIAAGSAGTIAPLMSIFFGNLTQDFVTFTLALAEAQSGTPGAAAGLSVAAAHFRHSSGRNAGYLALLGLGEFFTTYLYMHTWVVTSELNAKRIRERYLQAVLRQDPAFFDSVGAGEIVTRIQTDTHLVQQGISEKVALAVFLMASFFSGFILAYIRSWRMALVLSTMLPFMSLIGGLMGKFVAKYTEASLKHVAEGGTLAEEAISTIRTAHAFGTQETLARMYDAFVLHARRVDMLVATFTGGMMGLFYFAVFAAYALAFSYGVTLVNRGEVDAGAVVTSFMAVLQGTFALVILGPQMQSMALATGAAAKLFDTIDRVPPSIDSADPGGAKPSPVSGALTLEHVSFAYPTRSETRVLHDVSLEFPAGTTTALVGASGSGKSTVLALVERFYDPVPNDAEAVGVIRLDGMDVKEINIKYLRAQMGYVAQEPVLFNASVRDNVAYGLLNSPYSELSPEDQFTRIRDACICAHAHDFVSKLPEGYDTLVGERGFLLSGGQKQRLAIARAIVKDPKILLLDEATSALDTESEGIMQSALDRARKGRTGIVIAHRLSTIKDADSIYVMAEGKVMQHGTHNDLLGDSAGLYAQLVEAQKLRDDKEDSVTSVFESSTHPAEGTKIKAQDSSESLESLAKQQTTKAEEGQGTIGIFDLFWRLAQINRSSWRKYAVGSVFAILSGMIYPAYSVIYSKGIAAFSEPDPHTRRHLGDRTALYMFVVAIGGGVCISMQNYLFGSAAASFTGKLRSQLFRAILGQKIQFFDGNENNTGSLTSNLSDHPQKVKGLIGITLGAIIECIATLTAGWIVGLIFVWKLGLVSIACAPVLFLTGYVRLLVIVLKDETNKRAYASSALLACEASASARTVAALTAEDHCCALYSASLLQPLNNARKAALWSALLFALSQTISFWVISLVMWYGAVLVSRRECTTFEFFITLTAATFGTMNAGNVFSFAPDLSIARAAGTSIIRLLESSPGIPIPHLPVGAEKSAEEEKSHSTPAGHLKFDSVHFNYPTRPGIKVLRGLSFEVRPGEFVALVGASGSGKSTVIQLIERFYECGGGTISLDGVPVDTLDIQDYRREMALVSQEPTLYAGTIRFNILLGAIKPEADVSQQELEEVSRDANILEFIQSLPDGFETQVGGKGSQLSGGQKQRIAIARALVRDPRILLLDEATSALDSASEKVVQQALDNAAAGRSVVAIAHRLSTIQNADRIYFMKDGVISESGTHDELLRRGGDYASFVRLQALETRD